ncbi:50S ribosomal protein L10 [Roseospira marina]|uniref:Large ribosomal subunit protein uL10 n=1 Tax=Roseospira marina TaxID=140057 RepID=A0A5M6I7T5_9PROT|nr:50S ribosomal protein L10 [Roseospira marina]KAA5604286.1 50S ribosomal protein L10 [Roseospira marina]MBB4316135.1 large subunit ribosomal protein L10 [Roseospira marina]MBB5089335.1 large subunit ribosomal protein L10 [Roseospira marina]
MNRDEKKELVAAMHAEFTESSVCIVAHYQGLTVHQMETLRGKVRTSGAKFRVTKNRLTKLALAGTDFEDLADLFTGPTAIATSADPVAAAKACAEFAKTNDKLVILGGSMQGRVLDADGVQALAKMPSLDELRAKLVGLLTTPAQRVASVTQAPAGQLARVLKAYADSQSEAA